VNLRKRLEKILSRALQEAGAPAGAPAILGPSRRPELGDYQANGAMAAAKKARLDPRQLASEAAAGLEKVPEISTAAVAGPGFINVRLDDSWLAQLLSQSLDDPRLGVEKVSDPQTVVVDYSHPNLAKEMHVGHLRSTIIGDALVRTLEFLGHRVIRHNHVGDWGTQFGMLLAYLDQLREEATRDLPGELADLERFYREAKGRFDADAAFAAQAREYVVRLQGGDEHCLAAWRSFIGESLRHCEEIYRGLGITLQEKDVVPESFYNDELPRVIEDLEEAGLVTVSDGALCVFLDEFAGKDGTPVPALVRKSDGGYLYATTDLAAVRHRAENLQASRILYVVDARQSLHLQQVFAIARAAGFCPDGCSLEHLAFGTMMGSDGKPFKTREGGTIKLISLIREARERAYRLVSQKNPDLPEAQRRRIAHVVGIGALKYADLSQNRNSDYVFNWDRMLSLEGNTAPYMQYAYARVKSIFRRGGIVEAELNGPIRIETPEERRLGLALGRFEETIALVARDGLPHLLCSYLYELAGLFMSFYEACPVLKSPEPQRSSRLCLSLLVARTIQTGLGLLGIETIETM